MVQRRLFNQVTERENKSVSECRLLDKCIKKPTKGHLHLVVKRKAYHDRTECIEVWDVPLEQAKGPPGSAAMSKKEPGSQLCFSKMSLEHSVVPNMCVMTSLEYQEASDAFLSMPLAFTYVTDALYHLCI